MQWVLWMHRDASAGQEELGAAPHACCTLPTHLPAPTTVPITGTYVHIPSLAPAREGGEQALLCERRDQGSSRVEHQYLCWPGGTARWRKRGRGRAPAILCIPQSESKGRAVAPVLGLTPCEAVCVGESCNKTARGASCQKAGMRGLAPSPQLDT